MDAKIIDNFEKQGAILLKGVFKEWVNKIISGIERNLVKPSKYANENNVKEGRFFDDYCNWTRIKDFKDFIENSEAAKIAAEIMKSTTAQFFHDHVLVKEGGTWKIRASHWSPVSGGSGTTQTTLN